MSRRPITRARVTRALRSRADRLRRRFLPSFHRSLEDPTVPLSLDMDHDSATVMVAFGGIAGALQIPPFEFFNATGGLPIKRIFVRDLQQAWYHRGLRGHGSNIVELSDSLRRLLAPYEIERLIVTGTSMGGYASLVFGSLLGADTAIAFAPQTVLDRAVLDEIGDRRWNADLDRIEAAGGSLDRQWLDLSSALPAARHANTRYEILFDPALVLDRAHCERIAGIEGVQLIPREGGGHQLAKDMRDRGELEPLLRRALLGSPS
jgi:hypothetical protein